MISSKDITLVTLVAMGSLVACTKPGGSSAGTETGIAPNENVRASEEPCEGTSCDEGCGASKSKKCPVGHACSVGEDCDSRICDAAHTCAAPSVVDKVKNGKETDVDCGGPDDAKRCDVGKECRTHSDCETNGCAADGRCAKARSCTQIEGGQTCGPNEGMGRQNDCCERALVGEYKIDKYLITAGRMRAFLERIDGKVRDFVATLPADRWNQAYTSRLPNSMDGAADDPNSANTQLGPYFDKRACASGDSNGHTFWTPLSYGDTKQDFSKEVLDTKALNCVPWPLMAALCAFDGGHLLEEKELRAAFTNNGTTAYPWGARGDYSTSTGNEYAIQFYAYNTPNPPPDARRLDGDFLDATYYIAPPGRRPMGYGATGIADLAGNLLEWVGDSDRQFVWKGSFERHSLEADAMGAPVDDDPYLADQAPGQPWHWTDVVGPGVDPWNVNGYYALGGRCGY